MARFDCATWRPIGANIGGNLGPNLGLVLHHQAGNGSLFGFFGNPAAQVSAHFWVGKTGAIEQYVDTDRVAWHGRSLNTRYVGVETEGCPGGRDEPLTLAQLDALARLYGEGMRRHGWANALANADGQRGFGFHRMAVNTACPCQMRLDMRLPILQLAAGGAPPPPSPEDDEEMTVLVQAPNGGWTVVDLTRGEYRGISTPGLLDWYKKCGVKTVDRPGDWPKLKQVGTI